MKVHAVILLIVLGTFLDAQTFEEYKLAQKKAYKSYQNSVDVEFVSYLKQQWSYVKEQKPKALYKEKKPQALPTKEIQKPKKYLHEIVIDTPKPTIVTEKKVTIAPVSIQKEREKILSVEYYGLKLDIPIVKALPTQLNPIKKSDDFTLFWDKMSRFNFSLTTKQLHSYQKEYQLNGWSMYTIVKKLSAKVYDEQYEQELLSWFMLNKLGYKVKIGFIKSRVVLLSATDVEVFSTPFFTINNRRYYALDYYLKGHFGSLYTYKKDFATSTKSIDFSMKKLPRFADDTLNKDIAFTSLNTSLHVELNRHLLEYLKTFPQVAYTTYFETSLNAKADKAIIDMFYPLLKGKSKTQALNILLTFVQKSFTYETDWKQFGYEKVMFPSEILFYGNSDCDDRAVMFSYLAKRLLHVKVVGLKFSNHMATAIYYDEVRKGQDYLQNASFVVSDPTYINAGVGQAMPKYLNTKVKIIASNKLDATTSVIRKK